MSDIAPAGEPAETPDVDPNDTFNDPQVDTFNREYVEKLRKESAGYRTKNKEYEEKVTKYEQGFDGWTPEDQDYWIDTISKVGKGDPDGIKRLDDILKAVSPKSPETKPDEEPAVSKKFLTADDLQKALAAKDEEHRQSEHVKAISQQAKELGYDENEPEYVTLMVVAKDDFNGDIQKAHEKLQAGKQKIIDDYIAEKAAAASGHRPAKRGAPASREEQEIKDFAGSKSALESRLAAMQGQLN